MADKSEYEDGPDESVLAAHRISQEEIRDIRLCEIQKIMDPILSKKGELRQVLTAGQYARLREVKGLLECMSTISWSGRPKERRDMRTPILECLDSISDIQLSNPLVQEFANMMSEVLYESAKFGLTVGAEVHEQQSTRRAGSR